MAFNVAAASKTAAVILAVWGFMGASTLARQVLPSGGIGATSSSTEKWGLTLSDDAIKPAGAPAGPVVVAVAPDGPAAQRGVQVGDVVTGVNRMKIDTSAEAQERLDRGSEDTTYLVWRAGTRIALKLPPSPEAVARAKALHAPLAMSPAPRDPNHVGLRLGDNMQQPGEPPGPRVIEVEEGTLAATAGLRVADVIVSVNGRSVRESWEAWMIGDNVRAGSAVRLGVWRAGEEIPIVIKPAAAEGKG